MLDDTTVVIKPVKGFRKHPKIVFCADGIQGARLSESMRYTGHGYDITVPKEFYTDGGSIPWILRWWVLPWGKYYREFIVHDYMYMVGIRTRAECDTLLRRMIKDAGANGITYHTVRHALTVFGRFAWNKHRKHRKLLV